MYFEESGYKIDNQSSISVTTSEGNTSINSTVYIHNSGSNIVYIDTKPGVSSSKWELAAGEKIGPFHFEKLYHIGAGASTLKLIHLKGV